MGRESSKSHAILLYYLDQQTKMQHHARQNNVIHLTAKSKGFTVCQMLLMHVETYLKMFT